MKYWYLLSCFLFVFAMSPSIIFSSEKLSVFVSILPQKYFVEKVAGDIVAIEVLVVPGQSPATYDPTPKQMIKLSNASIFFRIGVPYEDSLIPKLKDTYPNLKIIDTRKGIQLRNMENHFSEAEKHHNHVHSSKNDPHTWLDPNLVKVQAKTICDALSKIDPEHSDIFRKNLNSFSSDLDEVRDKIAQTLLPFRGSAFLVFHPSYGYFADAFGLKQIPVELEGKNPSAKQIGKCIELAKKKDIHIIFVQPQFSTSIANALAKSIQGRVVKLDPLSEEYFDNLFLIALEIKNALSLMDSQ